MSYCETLFARCYIQQRGYVGFFKGSYWSVNEDWINGLFNDTACKVKESERKRKLFLTLDAGNLIESRKSKLNNR